MEEVVSYVKSAAYIGAAITMAMGALGPAMAQGMVGTKACENIGKYPESAGAIRTAMVIALAMIETIAIYSLLIAGGLIFFSK